MRQTNVRERSGQRDGTCRCAGARLGASVDRELADAANHQLANYQLIVVPGVGIEPTRLFRVPGLADSRASAFDLALSMEPAAQGASRNSQDLGGPEVNRSVGGDRCGKPAFRNQGRHH